MRVRLPLLCLAVAALVGGCGGAAGSGDIDPATYAPADSAVYLEAVVRPDGDQEENARAVAAKLLRTEDPGARIRELIDKAIRESDGPKGSFEEDIDPWLGDRIGMALSDLSQDEPRFAVVIAVRDEDAAAELVTKAARDEKARQEGDHWIDPDGTAYGVVGGEAIVVASDVKTFKRAEAAKDGEHLAGSERFDAALAELPEERIGTFYLDTRRFFDAAVAASNGDPSVQGFMEQIAGDLQPAGAALVAGKDTLTVETASKVASTPAAKLFGASAGGTTPLLRELPGTSWAALGIKDLGAGAKALVGQLGGALGGAFIQGQLDQLGIDLEQDVFSWIGDVALFASGHSVADIRGGAVIEVTDPERAAKAIPKLIGLARQQGGAPFEPIELAGADLAFRASQAGIPDGIVVALGGERAVIAYGEAAAEQALDPDSTIGSEGLYGRAKAATGGLEPSLVLDAAPIMELIAESVPAEELAEAKPYLDTLELLAAGSEKDGDRVRQRFVLKLR